MLSAKVVTKIKPPKRAREQFKVARDLIKQRKVDAARTQLLEIELGSSFTLFHRMMAVCAFIAKDYDLASSHIEQALSLEPGKQPVIAEAIRVYRAKKDDHRTRELFELFDISKASSGSELLRMALAMKSLSQFNEAVPALEKALRLSPDNVRIRNQYGIILTYLGRIDEAIRQWQFSLKYNHRDTYAKICLGRIHLHRNENLKAIEYFKETFDSESTKDGGKKLDLAEAYIRCSSVNEARELLTSLEAMDKNPRFHYLWGNLHSQTGDQYLAYYSYNRCIELGKEKGYQQFNQLDWPEQLTGDEAILEALKDTRPHLDSLFDPLILLKTDIDESEAQVDEDPIF